MTELIESTRAFEANISMIRGYDQMISTLVQGVLKES
jgi:flagellar basal body rod protein FlgG